MPKHPAFARPSRTLVGFGLLALTAMFCETAMFDWSSIYLRRQADLPPALAGVSYAAMMGAMALGRFAADGLVERTSLLTTLRLGAVLTATGLLVAVGLPYPGAASAGFVMVGVGLSPLVPLLMGAVGRTPNMAPSMALAWASTIGFSGALAAPPTLGFVSAAYGLRAAFATALAMACLFMLGANLSGFQRALAARGAQPLAVARKQARRAA